MDLHQLLGLGLGVCRAEKPCILAPAHAPRRAGELRKLEFEDALDREGGIPRLAIRIATWNVLAPAYVSKKAFPDVEALWLEPDLRLPRVEAVLERLGADVLCLQEACDTERWRCFLAKCGYEVAHAQRTQRTDGCAIAWKRDLFQRVGGLTVDFDEELRTSSPSPTVASRFCRKNVGLVVELELRDQQRGGSAYSSRAEVPFCRLLVATTHLYWGPSHEDVRSWQLHVFLDRIEAAYGNSRPLALCGDFNLLPGSASYSFLQQGAVEFPRQLRNVERFLFDLDISKLSRPLRLLGIDTALETRLERDERQRLESLGKANTGALPLPLFTRAICEGRVVVSASKRLLERNDCPTSYFLNARIGEQGVVDLCRDLAVELRPGRFFRRCVKCNGVNNRLGKAEESARARELATEMKAPAGVAMFECNGCHLVFWMEMSADSPWSRAQLQVDRLMKLMSGCSADVDDADAEQPLQRSASLAFLRDGGGRLSHGLRLRSVYRDVEGVADSQAEAPPTAAAADVGVDAVEAKTGREHGVGAPAWPKRNSGAVTNSKDGFHGCIDYVWLTPELYARGRRRLRVPTVQDLFAGGYGTLVPAALPGDTALRSLVGDSWPSDHWPLAVDLEWQSG